MLRLFYNSLEEIPEAFRSLYTSRNGRYELTGIEGIKTQQDVDNVQGALANERAAHSATKNRLRHFAEMNDEQLKEAIGKLDEYDELKIKAEGAADENKLNSLVEARITKRIGPVESERDQYKTQATEAETKLKDYQVRENQRIIHDSVRALRAKPAFKYYETAEEDVLSAAERMLEIGNDGKVTTRTNVGVTPGVSPEVWLQEMTPKRPHWFPNSQGGGARGSEGAQGGENPWTAKNWNATKQAAVVREDELNGTNKAEEMAKAAGSRVGAVRPPASEK